MAIAAEHKTQLITDYRRHDKDAGSPEIQVAILTSEIANLTSHMQAHKHDYASRRGLLRKVGQRNRLLRYLQRTDRGRYQELIQRLGLRK